MSRRARDRRADELWLEHRFCRSESVGSLRRRARPCSGRAVKQRFTWNRPERNSGGAQPRLRRLSPRSLGVQAAFCLISHPALKFSRASCSPFSPSILKPRAVPLGPMAATTGGNEGSFVNRQLIRSYPLIPAN
ncbi:hypothetical protein SKAU_G00206940 [Synaphobranchus kaupii]|uniref:Uncharacterized protein n=1 Tax=Synaphobranchus kaupii TaxID=118154 RepID=A0A9Q1F8B0_SYNKA|nr:hypothetical protein SKAU_G00206940 [Synaphobranchus kaupii]